MRRLCYNSAGCICVALGFFGLFLPLLPTTPFLLLAAFCFSRGAPRLQTWLLEHRTMGPIIRNWNERRVIPAHVKVYAAIAIPLVMSPALVFGSFHPGLKAISVLVGIAVIVMIFRQPS